MATKMPELSLTPGESKELADACLIVAREYDVKISGKTMATANLMVTAGIIYGVKGYAVYERLHSTVPGNGRQSQPAQQPENNGPDFSGGVAPIKWE